MKYREAMRAAQHPDVYDGPTCDQHRHRWHGSSEGDKDGDGEIGDSVTLLAKHFPPGTKLSVQVPDCPMCGESAAINWNPGGGQGPQVHLWFRLEGMGVRRVFVRDS